MILKSQTLKKFKSRNLKNIDIICYATLLFLVYVMFINKLYPFYVLDDEFGYWSNAAYFTGLDWSSATSRITYYSYGYSLLLVPLFWIFDNPVILYRAALVLNAFALTGSFFICLDISERIAPELRTSIKRLISFCVFMFPSYIIQAKVGWSECILISVYWLITWTVIYLSEERCCNTYKRIAVSILSGFLAGYIYMIHQRSIGVLVSLVLIMIILKICRRIKWKEFVCFFLTLTIMLIVAKLIKENIQNNLWLGSISTNSNDFSGQTQKIKTLFSFDGIINFTKILIGHSLYIFASTELSIYFALYYLTKNIIIKMKETYALKKDISKINGIFFFYCFLILAFVSTILISAIFLSIPDRIDHVIYGRYVEMTIGPLLLIGFIGIYDKFKISIKSFIIALVIFLMMLFMAFLVLDGFDFTVYNFINMISLPFYPVPGKIYYILISGSISMFIVTLLFVASKLRKKKSNYICGVFLIIILLFFYIGFRLNNHLIGVSNYKKFYLEVSNYIDTCNNNLPIYYLINNDFNNNSEKAMLQFYLPDQKIQCVTLEELKNMDEKKFLFICKSNIESMAELSANYELYESFNVGYLLKTKETNNNNLNIIIKGFSTINGGMMDETGSIISAGNSGLFMYGPYITLESGSYKFKIDAELEECIDENIGYFEIVSGAEQLVKIDLTNDMFIDGMGEFELNLNLQDKTNSIEIRAFANENVILKVNSVNFVF